MSTTDPTVYLARLSDDWRIVWMGTQYELQHRDPAKLRWHWMAAGSLDYCRYAYGCFSDGEQPVSFDEWDSWPEPIDLEKVLDQAHGEVRS